MIDDRKNGERPFSALLADVMAGRPIEVVEDAPAPPPLPQQDPVVRWRAIADAMADAGWPRRAMEYAAEADEKLPGILAVASWLTESGLLVLAGNKGTGKTGAACWWAMRVRRASRFIRAAELARTSRYNAEAFSPIMDASALVLDDLGVEYLDAKGSFLVDLDELMDRYYSDRKPLLLTTNMTGKQFAERYGARIASRVRDCARWVSIGDESLRRNP